MHNDQKSRSLSEEQKERKDPKIVMPVYPKLNLNKRGPPKPRPAIAAATVYKKILQDDVGGEEEEKKVEETKLEDTDEQIDKLLDEEDPEWTNAEELISSRKYFNDDSVLIRASSMRERREQYD